VTIDEVMEVAAIDVPMWQLLRHESNQFSKYPLDGSSVVAVGASKFPFPPQNNTFRKANFFAKSCRTCPKGPGYTLKAFFLSMHPMSCIGAYA